MDSVRPAEASKTAFELVLFGPPTLRDAHGHVPVGLGSGKPLALLCFLAIRGEVRREEALALLWGDVDENRARNAFRQALHRLRLALGEDLVPGDRQTLRIAIDGSLRSDVGEFEKAVSEGRFDEAIALCRGDLLEGFDAGSTAFDEWASGERGRLRTRCQFAAEQAVQRALAEGRVDAAATAIRKLVAIAADDPRAVEIAASSLLALGRRAEAGALLEEFRRRSSESIGAQLAPSLQRMLDRLASSPADPPSRPPGELPDGASFVGRDSELAKLVSIWRTVGDATGATVFIEGPTGIGKTRLAREFTASIRALGSVHVLRSGEWPAVYAVPYSVVVDALRPLVRAHGVAGASPHLLAEAARLLPELRDSFELPPIGQTDASADRLRIFEGLAALLEAAAFEQAICLVLEDVHRSSRETLELLTYLVQRLRRAPVMFVLTLNADRAPDETLSGVRALAANADDPAAGSGMISRLPLSALSDDDIGAITSAVMGRSADAVLVERVVALVGGNPQRAIEFAKAARDGAETLERLASTPVVESAELEAQSPPLSEQTSRGWFTRLFPHWPQLVAAAAMTIVIAVIVLVRKSETSLPAFTSSDTLVVSKAQESRRGFVRLVTSDVRGRPQVSSALSRLVRTPAWVDSLSLPWTNALPSPTGRFVALERITRAGPHVYLIRADRRDTVQLVGAGAESSAEGLGMGWSPDGEWFLATRRRETTSVESHFGLFAFPLSRPHLPAPIDTAASHSVVEAVWSPDGSRIAWVARVAGREEDVFVSWADGSHRRNVSAHPAQDDHIAWSADGSLIAFTSRRDGNAELYAYDLLNEQLWRLTQNPAHDDRASFAADGRFIAFESTRGGAPDVYVMPSLGGAAWNVGDSTSHFEVLGWRRAGLRYVDRLEFDVPDTVRRGDTVAVRLRAGDQFGAPMVPLQAAWSIIDGHHLRAAMPTAPADSTPLERQFVALGDGLARIEVSVGAWRVDTAYVRIGEGPVTLMRDDFRGALISSRWFPLGKPVPSVGSHGGTAALLINADRSWDSGVLSKSSTPLMPGLAVEATLRAPFTANASATTASLALVAPEPADAIDAEAPRFLRLISVTWNADAKRLVYAAEREVFVEPVPAAENESQRVLKIRVRDDGTVGFLVDGVERWRSTVRVVRSDGFSRAQIWLGGQDTGARVSFSDLSATLSPPRALP